MAFIPKDARWYLADVVLEHTVEADPRNVVHVNIHLVEADSPEREKACALGRDAEQVYANSDGKEVRVVFRGLRDLNVIHEALEDGAEQRLRRRTVDEAHPLLNKRRRQPLSGSPPMIRLRLLISRVLFPPDESAGCGHFSGTPVAGRL
jgi:hypothetical protein